MIRHLNITVTGRVQGVWFRASTRDEALRLGINGFVGNCADGSVYLEAEGEEQALAELLAWLEKGPPLAKVVGVEHEESHVVNLQTFAIRR